MASMDIEIIRDNDETYVAFVTRAGSIDRIELGVFDCIRNATRKLISILNSDIRVTDFEFNRYYGSQSQNVGFYCKF